MIAPGDRLSYIRAQSSRLTFAYHSKYVPIGVDAGIDDLNGPAVEPERPELVKGVQGIVLTKRPGPRAPPGIKRPRRNITALSYSFTI